MVAIDAEKGGYLPEIIGYAEPWIAAPGDSVAIKISCTEPEYKYRTVRLIQGIDLEHSPEKAEEEVKDIPRGQRQGRFQTAQPGSYGYVPNWGPPIAAEGLQVSFYMQPWLVDCSHVQTLVSTLDSTAHTGFSIALNHQGSLDISVGTGHKIEVISTGLKHQEKTWSKVKLVFNGRSVRLSLTHIPFRVEPVPPPAASEWQLNGEALLFRLGPLLVAASQSHAADNSRGGLRSHVTDFFNGRIDRLTLKSCGQKPLTLAKYDFSLDMSSDRIVDTSGRGYDGVLINAPTRAVKGHDWDGSECDWTRAKSGYGAIHFHDDDLDDAEWDTDFVITIPSSARSGAYAVEVEAVNGRDRDSITFFVRPTHWSSDNSKKVCLVFSTFTYLAYANERMYDTSRRNDADLGPGFDINKALKSAEFYKMRRRGDLGLSCYDRHNDGSGVCFSSSKRPILNVRPGYVMWAFSRPREFSADLMMLGFLEREGIPYEILTDHDLHVRGAGALQCFNTVITGCHPEYPTLESYSAYSAFARGGGSLMYLGGNGFYWVSALNAARPHRLEVRRGDTGVRPYGLPGGEHVNGLDGQRGGLWRSRGMSCNTLFGVGFCAQGTGPGVPYRRTEVSRDPKLSWMFTGVDGDLIGEHGFGGGASGDEIDRYDMENGSPEGALTLATSTGHSDDFGIAIEDLSYPALNTLGTQTNLIRSDVVYYVGAGGGAVFSVGSINWYCSLAWDGYNNNVARLTGNVIKGFLAGKR
ncbi:hypothetical protein NA57DRAFT_67751 [Rhizodiscina lignyota]|uniref:N,N-dimethylformamidase beta subunit-like C-terminal domain-containing protein n=1 Tax=Rhizodiscina lignyota TaxID=1504668 RepID=A0A9P4I6T5_9PEZI|nr:hypothetical protein NA57DRAFT_67751 [Rhizodiscina lignyota]